MHLRTVLALLTSLSLATLAEAQRADCGRPQTTQGRRECLDEELRTLEPRLHAALDSAAARLGRRGPVDSAQQVWEAYRRAQCGAEAAEFEGGSFAPVATLQCFRDQTRARLKEVRAMYRNGRR